MKKVGVIFSLIVLFYICGYLLVRQNYREIWERDNKTYVIFPENKFLYYLFRPLVLIDGALTGMQFHIGQHR